MDKLTSKCLLAMAMIMCIALTSCNKDDVITGQKPVISIDSETGVYTVKTGRKLTLTPTVEHADNAMYSWLLDGKLVSSEPSYTFTAETLGKYYLTFRVETEAGSTSEEMRIDVVEMAPPIISFALPAEGLKAESGRSYELTPDVQNKENATFEWKLNGNVCSTDESYTFKETTLGNYTLILKVVNEDGSDERTIPVNVIDRYPITILFPKPTYFATTNNKTVALGRSICLSPYIGHAHNPAYSWEVNGQAAENATGHFFTFTPKEEISYQIKMTVTDRDEASVMSISRNVTRTAEITASAEITVTCCKAEGTYKRSSTTSSSSLSNKVYAFIPAPGQFINETSKEGGFTGNETSHELAISYAESRLKATNYVSLGGWGGYIVVGFDHSIDNKGGYSLNGESYDFAITGNAFTGSSEAGIVYVMQDTNGNGQPDDEWYELKGSEYGKEETIQNYTVTYYRPTEARMNVSWSDNLDKTGIVPYMGAYHTQLYYYPIWIKESSYTLYGTCLKSRVSIKNGQWYNGEFDWGYADNYGSDRITSDDNHDADPKDTFFKISNAIHPDGTAANLAYIDFIKVQTGTNASAGGLGENSTEVFRFKDMNISK